MLRSERCALRYDWQQSSSRCLRLSPHRKPLHNLPVAISASSARSRFPENKTREFSRTLASAITVIGWQSRLQLLWPESFLDHSRLLDRGHHARHLAPAVPDFFPGGNRSEE